MTTHSEYLHEVGKAAEIAVKSHAQWAHDQQWRDTMIVSAVIAGVQTTAVAAAAGVTEARVRHIVKASD